MRTTTNTIKAKVSIDNGKTQLGTIEIVPAASIEMLKKHFDENTIITNFYKALVIELQAKHRKVGDKIDPMKAAFILVMDNHITLEAAQKMDKAKIVEMYNEKYPTIIGEPQTWLYDHSTEPSE